MSADDHQDQRDEPAGRAGAPGPRAERGQLDHGTSEVALATEPIRKIVMEIRYIRLRPKMVAQLAAEAGC